MTVTLILISFIAICLLTCVLFWYGEKYYGFCNMLASLFAILFSIVIFLATITGGLCGFSWYSAKYQAEIINKEYGIKYTQEQIFFAKDVIDIIHQINRQRIEVNGDLSRKEKKGK